jgi:hypothetical protein
MVSTSILMDRDQFRYFPPANCNNHYATTADATEHYIESEFAVLILPVFFCRNVESKTFGFFKISVIKEEPPSVYLMAITNLQWKKPASQDQATDSKTI